MIDFEGELGKAVKHFWQVRGRQKKSQGGESGKKDAGERGSVTGGKHADGFIRLIAMIVKDAALPKVEIHVTEKRPRTLPGFYRPCKEWDLVVLSGDTLVAVVEVKSQVGSFGNNFNNRVEEALGMRPIFGQHTERGSSPRRRSLSLGIYSCWKSGKHRCDPRNRLRLSRTG
jgi:Restriction endonuclease XhoI